MGNMIIGQSGGPTAVINASVAGAYTEAKKAEVPKIYGMVHGIEGFLKEDICDLREQIGDEVGVELLKRTPSAFLGSCRYKLPVVEGNEAVYEKIFALLEKYDIDTFLYAGGNDSMDTVKMLSDYAKENGKKQCFVGIPKTIDNDLPVTDHCPGFGSAAKYVATSIKEAMCDNESFGFDRQTVAVVEVMGRNAGWLAAAASLIKSDDCTGVDAIYLPEKVFDPEKVLEKVREQAKKKASVVIVVSEGVKLADGRYAAELAKSDAPVDAFGHKQSAGVARFLCNQIEEKMGIKTRCIEISTLQRAGTHLASLTDVNEAFAAGAMAAKAALGGETGKMVIFERVGNTPYSCVTKLYDIHEIANVEKKIPEDWFTPDGNYVNQKYEEYARPLIMGELTPIFVNGIPRHLKRK